MGNATKIIYFTDTDLSAYARKVATNSIDLVLSILLPMLERNHDPEDHVFSRAITLVCYFRENTLQRESYHNNFLKNCDGLGLPESFLEMFGRNCSV